MAFFGLLKYGFKVRRRLKIMSSILVLIEAIGVLGVMFFEKKPFNEALYITTMLITGIGAEGFIPSSMASRYFFMLLTFFGIGAAVSAVVYIFGPLLYRGLKEVSNLAVSISSTGDHVIVCGYNPFAKMVIEELQSGGKPFVIISNDPKEGDRLLEEGLPVIKGDSSEINVLQKANVAKAKAVLAVEDTDTQNALVVLTARNTNPKVFILAKADDRENVKKLRMAGADEVLCPAALGARKAAELVEPRQRRG